MMSLGSFKQEVSLELDTFKWVTVYGLVDGYRGNSHGDINDTEKKKHNHTKKKPFQIRHRYLPGNEGWFQL